MTADGQSGDDPPDQTDDRISQLVNRIDEMEKEVQQVRERYSVTDAQGREVNVPDLMSLGLTRRQALGAIGALAIYGMSIGAAIKFGIEQAKATDTSSDQVGSSSVSGGEVDIVLDEIIDAGGDVVADVDDTGDIDWQSRGFDNLASVDTDELNGGVTGSQSLTSLTGSNLSINSGTLDAAASGLYSEDGNSPFSGSSISASTDQQLSLNSNYDHLLIFIKVTEESGNSASVRFIKANGTSFSSVWNYDFTASSTTGATRIPVGGLASNHTMYGLFTVNGRGDYIEFNDLPAFNSDKDSGLPQETAVTEQSGPVNSLTFETTRQVSYEVEVYGRDQ